MSKYHYIRRGRQILKRIPVNEKKSLRGGEGVPRRSDADVFKQPLSYGQVVVLSNGATVMRTTIHPGLAGRMNLQYDTTTHSAWATPKQVKARMEAALREKEIEASSTSTASKKNEIFNTVNKRK